MTDTIPRRVARGAALLDEKLPGWVDRIDLEKLDLRDTWDCILGQGFADKVTDDNRVPYNIGIRALFAGGSHPDGTSIRHGFDGAGREYELLTAEWTRVILARREEASC